MGTTNDPAVFETIVSRYELGGPAVIRAELTGMNNTTRFVYAGGRKYVLRIYENHRDESKLRFEHFVLEQLKGMELPIHTPRVRRPRGDNDTFVRGPDGKLAAMFDYIAGSRPDAGNLTHAEGMGAAIGALVKAFTSVEAPTDAAIYQPYYLLHHNYPAVIGDLRALLSQHEPDEALQGLENEIHLLTDAAESYSALVAELSALPHQLIHGDIVFDNALAEGDAIIGILDFEFVTYDLRAMELAVIAGELLKHDDLRVWEKAQALFSGYGRVNKLSREEAEAIPALIKLRKLDVFLHFADRYIGGLDEADVLRKQIKSCAALCTWIDSHGARLRSIGNEALV